MTEPHKKLSPEEEAYISRLKKKQKEGLFGSGLKAFFLLLFVFFAAITLYAMMRAASPHPNMPAYADCAQLLSPSVHQAHKLKILARYFPMRPLCHVSTGYFTVNNVFQTGTTQVRLTLALGPYNFYEMDGRAFLQALLPDKDIVPVGPASHAAMEIVQALDAVNSGTIDIARLTSLLGKSGALASYAGENAGIIKAQLLLLANRHQLPEAAILVPPWLDALAAAKTLRPKDDPRIESAEPAFSGFRPGQIWQFLLELGRQ